ncbi:MAG TPA: SLC13 family permease [Vicinamibacterales bacterium]|nr:SLC13 family permease [Vicinamibacterales bacterium]
MLTPAVVSLLALLAAIVLSCTSQLNVGLIAIAAAWLIGAYVAGWPADAVAGGFPTQLFLTLAGVTLLFALSDVNGTVASVARRVLRLARGSTRVVPLLFFAIAMAISTIGPGAIASVALVVPIAMALGAQSRVPPLLTALMVANGANAGNLSPLSAVGVIANTKMADAGLGGHEWKVWAANFVAHALVAAVAWALFGGFRKAAAPSADASVETPPIDRRQAFTIAVVAVWIVAVVVIRAHIGFSAFVAAVLLIVTRAADEAAAVRRMPWSPILMVCGVSLLVGVLEKTGGMELFTALLARVANPSTLNGVIAFITGAISTYSSTSGVVLPTFLPMAPGLVARVGGGDPLAVALSINVGASLVDVSPLSTIGALCVGAVADTTVSKDLFRKMLLWGLAMTVVGALLCQWLASPLARL